MAIDWEEHGEARVCVSRGLIARAFSYFLPYRLVKTWRAAGP